MTLDEYILRCEIAETGYRKAAEDYLSASDYNNFARCIALAEEERVRLNYLKKYKEEV